MDSVSALSGHPAAIAHTTMRIHFHARTALNISTCTAASSALLQHQSGNSKTSQAAAGKNGGAIQNRLYYSHRSRAWSKELLAARLRDGSSTSRRCVCFNFLRGDLPAISRRAQAQQLGGVMSASIFQSTSNNRLLSNVCERFFAPKFMANKG